MNTKMLKRAAECLVLYGYKESSHIQYKHDTWGIFIFDPDVDNIWIEVDPFANTLEGREQLDALEKHYRINTQQNSQGDVNTEAPPDYHVKVGGASPRYGRIACIESCLRQDTIHT